MASETLTRIDSVTLLAAENAHQSPTSDSQYNLSIVIPTRNERDNVLPLLETLQAALTGISVEVILVDDSDDDTPAMAHEAAMSMNSAQFYVLCEHREVGPARAGGLATAVQLGMTIAHAEYLAVIDADLQHPPQQLRRLYDEAITNNADIALATRYRRGGSYAGLDGVSRRLISRGMKWTAKLLFPDQLLRVSDPLGGFFLLRKSLLDGVILRPIGFKISLEILIRCQWARLIEVPYHFRARRSGQSKSNLRQGMMALRHMLRLLVEIPAAGRFWKFCCVGGSGVLVNVFVFALALHQHAPLWLAWLAATEASVLSNFVGNAVLFWHGTKQRSLVQRMALFHGTSAAGVAINLLFFLLFSHVLHNTLLAQLVAVVFGVGMNYWLTKRVVFPSQRQAPRVLVASGHRQKRAIKERISAFWGAVTVVGAVGVISYTHLGAWIVLATLFLGLSQVLRREVDRQKAMTILLGVVAGVALIDYVTWRFEVTNWAGWWIAVPLFVAEALGVIHTLGMQITLWPWEPPHINAVEDPTLRPIFVFIPTVNEGEAILAPTVRATLVARERYLAHYPDGQVTIVLCNDGFVAKADNWQEPQVLAARLGVRCVTRTSGGGAKAGNIEHARQQVSATGAALIVIFDADQIAKPDFLMQTISPFADPTVGWVQTGQYYHNLENPVARWAHDQQALFYHLLCPGKAAQNSAFICGTNVVLRAAALDQIGGLPQSSVTEDFAASIDLHPFWRSIFLTDELATGLGPMDMPAYFKQQRRWAIGTLGVLRSHWRAIFLPKRHGLRPLQRFQYMLACTHYLCGLRDFIYVAAPLLFLATGIPAVRGSTLALFLWHFLPYWAASMLAFWYSGRGKTGLRGVVIGFGSFPTLIGSLATVITGRQIGFAVTAKQRETRRSWRHLTPHLLGLLCCLAGIGLVFHTKQHQQAAVIISVMWIIYTMVMLVGFLWLGVADMRFRAVAHEVPTPQQQRSTVRLTAPRHARRRVGLASVGVVGTAIVVASSALLLMRPVVSAQPITFVPQLTPTPAFGLSLPVELLNQQPAVIKSDLGTSFSIIGRTQDSKDSFDRAWANQLTSQHEQPWITLQFGEVRANGLPPLDASLTAISNGTDDSDLQRWAQAIRAYGQPLFLTVLLHVDRNWAISSAVADGGIPQDAPRAWQHIQAVFNQVGAKNVAWVWSPADPSNDQSFAPPASSINVVLLSMISYPNTAWANSTEELNAVTARYPDKPLFIEVSADGPPQQKAQWLEDVGTAVKHTPNVYALIYHEGAPEVHATSMQDQQWSLASDPLSLQAMKDVVTRIQSN